MFQWPDRKGDKALDISSAWICLKVKAAHSGYSAVGDNENEVIVWMAELHWNMRRIQTLIPTSVRRASRLTTLA